MSPTSAYPISPNISARKQPGLSGRGGIAAIDEIAKIARDEKSECELKWVPGYLHGSLREEEDHDAQDLQKEADLARELGFDAEYLDRVPYAARPGIRFKSQAKFHPLKYLAPLLNTIHGGGSYVLENTEAGQIETDPMRVHCGNFKIKCEYLVIATHNPLLGKSSVTSGTLFQTKLALYISYVLGARLSKSHLPRHAIGSHGFPPRAAAGGARGLDARRRRGRPRHHQPRRARRAGDARGVHPRWRGGAGGTTVALLAHPDADWLAAFWASSSRAASRCRSRRLSGAPSSRGSAPTRGRRRCRLGRARRARALDLARGRRVLAAETSRRSVEPRASTWKAAAGDADATALLLYTSGTTGKPKGAMITHANLAAQAALLREAWGCRADDRLLHALPLHHLHGLGISLLTSLLAGGAARMLPRFDARARRGTSSPRRAPRGWPCRRCTRSSSRRSTPRTTRRARAGRAARAPAPRDERLGGAAGDASPSAGARSPARSRSSASA